MYFTNEQKRERDEIANRAMDAGMAELNAREIKFSADQLKRFCTTLARSVGATLEDEPTPSLAMVVTAITLLVAAEVLGLVPSLQNTRRAVELAEVGALAARHLLATGGYPEPSSEQMRKVAQLVTPAAQELVLHQVEGPRAAQVMRDAAAAAVLRVFGPRPSTQALN
ncbi:hypothetical protein [Archangium lansingense]|uniref:Uncharacterized protein n=1 Tax=Archangium lansingense TaxID=2995310 RepID=A0ABT4AB20_9BACT|nr:hypothetical protein [Archangium lansinium]MCY1078872.1 hypothetical protein [Archangium lansinium]